ncbi:MAG: hypothetical protein CO023_00570 [Flavobacteriales bacterium CG_4_9_14_0_2_um_filter_35_242]|nr:hypothetical protein [Zetaproteobacteria bacterium]NDK17760.1 hypothetical protein [Flavobacteriales bacterium]OIO10209.1 MAG: hypothetical protein AUJ53_07450 [Flavobacteriaceae bacterium CG1_02_35_72]PIR14612.1 MAG: hypothetical protein COV50_01755 [Flavobacteriales bacterium CG11_big_fil_rev_8_21_14_0_20_35_7]PIV17686.1 MAG: hypothetical protein COS42_03500 [Flavobacteriales bacterium CG03_land_8_20_14_0_80_35_15]PJA06932.1 MAG: hypothetical protein COX71_00675 [Flavobacteriales bacteriu
MIYYLLNHLIDKRKYDACIKNAPQAKVYAFSWYLDCVAQNWDVLVLNDYEAVMPLPHKKKYGVNYIFQPFWIQHLGIFSTITLTEVDLNAFIAHIPKKFKLIDYNINFKSNFESPKVNYILPLYEDYKCLFKNFSKGRKSSISQAQKSGIVIKESEDFQVIIELFKQNRGLNIRLSERAYIQLDLLLKQAQFFKCLKITIAYSDKNRLLGGAFFILSNKRITYLFSAINQQGRDLQAMSLILNTMIKRHAKSGEVLDFEGSMLTGVAAFIKSFGTQQELYYHLKKWQLF